MAQTTHPSKDLVRNWLHQRQAERTPPPTPEQVREELGWKLIEAERRLAGHAD
jgi:phosphoribosylaminoimidazole-succinocarboxamide synthase